MSTKIQIWRADCLLIDTDNLADNMIDVMSIEEHRYFLPYIDKSQAYIESAVLVETNKIISNMMK